MGLLISEKLIYGHPPKTGGTWATKVMREAGLGDLRWGRSKGYKHHDPPRFVPEKDRAGKEIVVTIRPPWQWATSYYYHFLKDGPKHRKHMAQFSADMEFQACIRAMFEPEKAAEYDEDESFRWPVHPWRLPWRDMAACGSWYGYFMQWYCTDGEREIVDTYIECGPDMRLQLAALLERYGADGNLAHSVKITNPSNKYPGSTAVKYLWSQELIDLAYEKTRPLCDRFGWQPPKAARG